jgi:uncharacterized Zn-binding protein involved in type VI secretion/phage gp45-like
MLDLEGKIMELLERNSDPRKGISGRIEFAFAQLLTSCPPVTGIVVDNRDPECAGRIRVSYDFLIPGSVSPWLPVVGQHKRNGAGFWTLPETGTQALIAFTSEDRSRGFVLGFIYDRKHLSPIHSTKKPTGSTLFQTKNHRLEITDGKDKEEIRAESAEGKMRVIISREGGIQLINELGNISIKCENLKVIGEEEIHLKAKSFGTETHDALKLKTKGTAGIESDKEAKLKGRNIRMSGSLGVTAEGKQIAVQDDRVMGFDTHIMVVPAGTSTANVPLPHPFIGKMTDRLSEDVKIGNRGCAVKGSKARHDDRMHMQLPGTIRFQDNPKCDGEVTGGTSANVKIDGKEAAVIGSQVTTCNDIGMQNNSIIMEAGISMPMPSIINPLNAEEFRREQEEKERKVPQLQNVRWSKTRVKEGEEVELTAGVKDIADGNMVTLQVFPDGRGPEDSAAYAKFPLTVRDGAVSARWKWISETGQMLPETDPKFIFTAHCAWCGHVKSSNTLEVKIKHPEITKVEWQDKDGNVARKSKVDEFITLYAETKDVEDGVTFHIYDVSTGKKVISIGADIKGDKAEAEWSPIDVRMAEDTNALKYKFEATGNRCKPVESGELQVKNPRVISIEWNKKAVYYGDTVTLRIKSLEMKNEKVIICLYDDYFETGEDYLFEKELSINNDLTESDINIDFPIENLKLTENDLELFLHAMIETTEREKIFISKETLRIGLGYKYE